jgi:replicative DNA helicase Mcm
MAMAYEEIKKMIVSLLKNSHNKSLVWSAIYSLLLSQGFPKSSVSMAKSQLIDEGIISEKRNKDGKKVITLIRDDVFGEVSIKSSVDDEYLYEHFRDYLVTYFKDIHGEDIILENEKVVVDLNQLYNHGLVEFAEILVNNPQKGIEFLKECYEEAYYSFKNEYPGNVIIVVKNLPEIFKTTKKGRIFTIEDIKSKTLGKLVEFEGIIVMASQVRPKLTVGVYVCPQCGKRIVIEYDSIFDVITPPKCCNDVKCLLLEEESVHIDVQELKVQQPLDLMENPEDPPKYITVLYENTPGIYSGRVKITGIPQNVRKKSKSVIGDIYIRAIHIEPIETHNNVEITPEDVKNIEKIAKRKDVIDLLADRLIPEIKGNLIIKKAIFLQQVKGSIKRDNTRHNIHILLITDPGVGKTVMLRRVAKIMGNEYTSMTSTSGVGLTAAVVREKTLLGSDTWVIKPGILVRANGGTACIDEFSVRKDAYKDILEAMESQVIHLNKGGISAKLPAECAILAACNPKRGRFDRNLSVIEQIDIPAPLLSRFDLIFPLMDKPNRDGDKAIVEHIVNRAIYTSSDKEVEGYDYVIIDGIKVDFEFIVKYIMYARKKRVILSQKAKEIIVNWYLDMRKLGEGDNPVPITARQAEAAIRISEAVAKAKLKDVVEEEDVKEAIEIIESCLREIAYDPETGTFDVDKIMGVHRSERKKLDTVLEIIKELSHGSLEVLVDFEEILSFVEEKGINEKELERLLNKLKKLGDIDEPKPRRYRLI